MTLKEFDDACDAGTSLVTLAFDVEETDVTHGAWEVVDEDKGGTLDTLEKNESIDFCFFWGGSDMMFFRFEMIWYSH